MVRPHLILIGYWRREEGGGLPADHRWPSPQSYVGETWDEVERDQVHEYLTRGFVVRACMGSSPCRLCGVSNGSLELSDAVYVWPEGLAHYVRDHGVRPPEPLVTHVLSTTEELEMAGRDESWLRGQTGSGET